MFVETGIIAFASILTVLGLIGSFVPVLPGALLNYIAILLLNHAKGGVFSSTFLLVFGILTVFSLVVDYVIPLLGTRMYGASRYGMWGTIMGMLVGFILGSFPGMVLGMVIGAVSGELLSGKKGGDALKSGVASLLGSAAAVIVKFGLSAVMAGFFLIKAISA